MWCIVVNGEMLAREEMLEAAGELLKSGGRLSVITYHSLEDRIVKRFMNAEFEDRDTRIYGGGERRFRLINRRPIVASEEEVERNPRARSGKLRIAEKI